jgi:AcrR family transcriptional regulator
METMGGGPHDDAQRIRLLEGLATSIREKGLAQTQLADIVREARASRRTFYKHFPDKDSCFVELARRLSDIVQAQLAAAIDRDAEWTTQVEQAIDAYLGMLGADPAMTLTFSSPSLGATVVRAQREAIDRYAQFVVEAVADAAERDGENRSLSHERAFMLVSGLHSTVVRAVERDEDIMALAPEFHAVFKAAIASPPSPVSLADYADRASAATGRPARRAVARSSTS